MMPYLDLTKVGLGPGTELSMGEWMIVTLGKFTGFTSAGIVVEYIDFKPCQEYI